MDTLYNAIKNGTCLVYSFGLADNWDFEIFMAEQRAQGDYRNSRVERIFTPPTEAESLVVAEHLRTLQGLCSSVAVENGCIVQYVHHARFPKMQNDRRSLIAMRNSVASVLLERIKRLSRRCFQEVADASEARFQMNYMNGLALYGTSLQFSDNLQAQVGSRRKAMCERKPLRRADLFYDMKISTAGHLCIYVFRCRCWQALPKSCRTARTSHR